MQNNAIILFTRIPVPGKTKTRLQPFLTGEECCLLQQAFLTDIYRVLRVAETPCDIVVCYNPEGNVAGLEAILPKAHIFFPQQGEGLGEKMHNAIRHVLENGYNSCLLIGSDIPLLQPTAIDDALRLLGSHDIVLCPTADGGYYLIGMNEPCEDVFRLEYGTSGVLEKTLEAAASAGKTCAIGQSTMDIDNPQDLFSLAQILAQENSPKCEATRKVLKKLLHGRSDINAHRSRTNHKI